MFDKFNIEVKNYSTPSRQKRSPMKIGIQNFRESYADSPEIESPFRRNKKRFSTQLNLS